MKYAVVLVAAWALGCSSEDGAGPSIVGTAGNGGNGGTSAGGMTSSGGLPSASGGAPMAASGGTPMTASGGALGSGGAPVTPSGAVITTTLGKVQGFVEGETNAFLGVPYGAPPTGEQRFAPPKAAAPWTDVRAATSTGNVCPRAVNPTSTYVPLPPQSEDCLNLSVFAPKQTAQKKAPVVVFIPTNANGDYDGAALSQAGGLVVVTMNYRTGPFANLVNPSLDTALGVPSGNMGLRDQQLALRWIKDNIGAFGGDPDDVTVVGQACLHAFLPGSRELVKRFVMNSVSCVSNPVVPLNRQSVAWISDKLVAKHCTGNTDVVACLRGLPADTLASFKNIDTTDPGPDPFGQAFLPQMDGVLLPDYPKHLLTTGDFHHGEILAGANRHEARITRLDPEQTKQLTTKIAFGFYGIFTYITQWGDIQSLYTPATDADAVDSFERVSTDTWFRCPIRAAARAASAGGSRVFLYSFDLAPAPAGMELDYLFGQAVESAKLQAPPFDVAAPVPLVGGVVAALQSSVARFARTGDPNGGDLPTWPAYGAAADQHLVFDTAPSVATAFSKAECDAWDTANAASLY